MQLDQLAKAGNLKLSKHNALVASLTKRLTNEVTQLKNNIADRKSLYQKLLVEKDKVLKSSRDELERFRRFFFKSE